jgi:hypothetical protein
VVSPEDDASHAASAETAAQTISKRNRYDAFDVGERLPLDWSHPVFAEYCCSRLGVRPIRFITQSP